MQMRMTVCEQQSKVDRIVTIICRNKYRYLVNGMILYWQQLAVKMHTTLACHGAVTGVAGASATAPVYI